MKLSPSLIKHVEAQDVLPGNIYPAKGGRKSPGTEWWLVIAVSDTVAHCIGFNKDGEPCSATSYLKGAMRERPVVGKVDLSKLILEGLK